MACPSSAVAAVVSTWTTTSTVHTCLCHLPPSRRAYTCLTVYAASAVPQCTHCSAPCTASPLSLACGQADNDPYSWVLRILDMALGSCDPWCTAVVPSVVASVVHRGGIPSDGSGAAIRGGKFLRSVRRSVWYREDSKIIPSLMV